MGDDIEAVTETAKTVQEVAKTGRALIEPGTDLAKYLARVLGTVPEDVVGFLIGDPLHELRQHTLIGILRAAFEKLRARGVETAKPIRPGPGKDAFEAASLETDETLQDMWASLLANAMDPGKDTSLQRVFIDALRQLEPIDALILRHVARKGLDSSLNAMKLAEQLERRDTLIAVSLNRLAEIGVVILKKTQTLGYYALSPLGMELYLACQNHAPD